MKITKIGHCCLVVEKAGKKILTDPGAYSDGQNTQLGIEAVLITHEHQDHLHVDSLRALLKNNPGAKIFSNRGVATLLGQAGIGCEILEHGQRAECAGFLLEGAGERHAPIYPGLPEVVNTGYFIDGRLFYPGDAFYVPAEKVEILGRPVAIPCMRLSESVDYAKAIGPKTAFPVHDGMLKTPGLSHRLPQNELAKAGISFIPLEAGGVIEV